MRKATPTKGAPPTTSPMRMQPMSLEDGTLGRAPPQKTNRMEERGVEGGKLRWRICFITSVLVAAVAGFFGETYYQQYLGKNQHADPGPQSCHESGGEGQWDDETYLFDAEFEQVPAFSVNAVTMFSLPDMSSTHTHKGVTLRDLVYQSLFNELYELPTMLACTPIYSNFYDSPEIPPYCYFEASEFPVTNHSVLVTLDPASTYTPPIISTYRPDTNAMDKLESWIAAIAKEGQSEGSRIVMPTTDVFFLQGSTGEVLDNVGNNFEVKAYMRPRFPVDSKGAVWMKRNFDKEGLITSNGFVSFNPRPSKREQLAAEDSWNVLATPHFSITLQGNGNCAVNGLDNNGRLILTHEGNIGSLQLGGGSVQDFTGVFTNVNTWLKDTTQSGDPLRYKYHAKGNVYAIPFNDLEVNCNAFQTEVESIVSDFIGQNGVSPLQRYDLFDEKNLRGFKVHSDSTGSTRVVYLGLHIHSDQDSSSVRNLNLPGKLGALHNFPSTASAIRDHVVAADEEELGMAFDNCFNRMCRGGSCANYVSYHQEVSVLKSAASTLETKLDVCTRCSAVGLDGVTGATIPYVDQHGEAGHAECDSYLANESAERRHLSTLWSNSNYGEWSKSISAYKFQEMPKYKQFEYNSPNGIGGQCGVGCGPVAWAMLFAWAERAWFDDYGFVTQEFGEAMVAPLCNDNHGGELYPFTGNNDRWWHFNCGAPWECDDQKSADFYGWTFNPDLPLCNNLATNVNNRIVEINEGMGTSCIFGGGLTTPARMDNIDEDYGNWHANFYSQGVTTRHNTLTWNCLGLCSWKNGYVRSQLRQGKPAVAGLKTGVLAQHYANALQYRWRTYTKCRMGLCWTSYDYTYYMNMGYGGYQDGWKYATFWFAGWVDAEKDRDDEEEYIAWLLCCEWEGVLGDDACSIDCTSYTPPSFD